MVSTLFHVKLYLVVELTFRALGLRQLWGNNWHVSQSLPVHLKVPVSRWEGTAFLTREFGKIQLWRFKKIYNMGEGSEKTGAVSESDCILSYF